MIAQSECGCDAALNVHDVTWLKLIQDVDGVTIKEMFENSVISIKYNSTENVKIVITEIIYLYLYL